MYPSSSSSSSSSSHSHSHSQTGLTRYGSAPGSLLTNAVDAVIGHYYSGETTTKVNSSDPQGQGSFHDHEGFGGPSSSSSSSALLRQRSSPAGFLTNLDLPDNAGFTITRGSGSYGPHGHGHGHGHGAPRLKSQLSFTGQHSLSHISEVSDNLLFSAPSPNKRSKHIDGDILSCLNALDSQLSLPQTTLEMAAMEKLMHIPEDSVPCKIRAKRGCATHPRSIAERERRTRISGKLKKLQDLVPNMDKQTSYADMLDLAVQHIKGLQGQVQKLHNELENCTCGCKQST